METLNCLAEHYKQWYLFICVAIGTTVKHKQSGTEGHGDVSNLLV